MRLPLAVAVLLQIGIASALAADPPSLRRVILSTGGVGYFEYQAEMDGAGTLDLTVPLGQIDDLLKSLVVFDPAGGVASVTLPGQDDTVAAFGDAPFGPDALASPLAYLNALRGTEVTVQGPHPMTGRIMQAENVPDTDGKLSRKRTRVTLLSTDGLQQFVLEDASTVQVADPALRSRIERVLQAVQAQSRQAVRHVSIHLAGGGTRNVSVGYVAGAPLWKATYRLVLDGAADDSARLQGWATLENQSGADWHSVALTLLYGNPVAFRQALYRSYFVQRPEVPVEVLGHVLPNVDTRARAMPAAPMNAPVPSGGVAMAKVEASMSNAAVNAEVEETGDETIFTLPQPVDLPAGDSTNVVIFDTRLPASRIGLVPYPQPHPLTSVRLKADGTHSLPAGVMTVYDTTQTGPSFAGDARVSGIPRGEERLVSFARDLRTNIETKQTMSPEIVTGLAAANGVLTYTVRARQVIQVTMIAPAPETRNLLIELPRGGPDQTLSFEDGKTKASEETATAYRVAVSLEAGETRAVTAYLDQPLQRTVALADGDESLLLFIGNQEGLDPASRAAVLHIVELRQAASRKAADLAGLRKQMDDLLTDEDRLRKNLEAVSSSDALHGRLVRALDAAETLAEALRKAINTGQADEIAARKAVADAIAALRA